MTYEEVDEVLTMPPLTENQMHNDLRSLAHVANLRFGWRERQGSLSVSNSFSRVVVEDAHSAEPRIDVYVEPTNTASWKLVSELMIAVCAIAGDIGAKESIPLPYRSQEAFECPPKEALEPIPDGPARAAAVFKNARGSEVRSEPGGHASLGLEAYVQVTSPIRRSTDLIAHLQLKAFLRGDPVPFDTALVEKEISRSQEGNRLARTLDQRTSKYWHLERLRRLGRETVHDAVFVKPLRDGDERRGFVELCDSAFQIVAQVSPGTNPGEQLVVRFTSVDPRGLSCRAEAVSKIAAVPKSYESMETEMSLDDILSDVTDVEVFP